MKTLKQVGMAAALTLLLGLSAFAGDIQIGAPAPPPPPPASSSATTTPSDKGIPRPMGTPVAPSDSMTAVALNLLQTVLAIF